MLSCPLINFVIQKYQNEPIFYGVYSKDNLLKLKDGACIINCDEYKSIRTWLCMQMVMM